MPLPIAFAEPLGIAKAPNSAFNGTRKKRFSHKTTTGCLTCRRRRVKCDETKPECSRCLNGGYKCAGYWTRQAKVFEPHNLRSRQSSDASPDSGIGTDEAASSEDSPTDQQIATLNAPSSPFRAPSLSPKRTPCTFFAEDEARAFSIWINRISPMLVNYGPASSELWPILIPQTVWEFQSVRELFLAIASTDDQFRTLIPRSNLKYQSEIIGRYNNAINHLRSNRAGKLETFFASILGWALETYHGNYDSGSIHIKVALKLAEELRYRDDEKSLMGRSLQDMVTNCLPNLIRSNAYIELMRQDPKSLYCHDVDIPPQLVKLINIFSSKDYVFSSVSESHDILLQLLQQPESFRTHSGSVTYILRQWDSADTTFRVREREPEVLRLANHLLFSLAMSLLPEDKVGGWNEAAPGLTLDHIYRQSREYMEIGKALPPKRRKQLLRILRILLRKTIEFYPQDNLIVQMQILRITIESSLQELESKSDTVEDMCTEPGSRSK